MRLQAFLAFTLFHCALPFKGKLLHALVTRSIPVFSWTLCFNNFKCVTAAIFFFSYAWPVGWSSVLFIRITLTFFRTGPSYGIPALFDTLEDLSDEDGTWNQLNLPYALPKLVNLIKWRNMATIFYARVASSCTRAHS